ncbi:Harbinger transposase-derived nuclease [Macleaya cordata]|uniref:Harbinger transposase-derived nuclease n=1 Tax=Macleaya cordata TaxID=56857 RepID=A0A200PRP2_MACCD|nr:Harbinger transposase-derived nuclease [Macleaya cordata]
MSTKRQLGASGGDASDSGSGSGSGRDKAPKREVTDRCSNEWIPNVVGSLQTTHIPILSPNKNNASAYRSEQYMLGKKAFYSIKLQGVVDHDCVFIDVDIGKPGKMSDDQILLESQLLRRDDRFTEGEWIVGNVSIPLMNRILVPYTQAPLNMTPTQITYNVAISKIREVGLEAIVKLKGRWVCLKQPLQFREDVANVVEACCVLHNMCRLKNDEIDPEWVVDDYENDIVFPPIASSDPASQARDKIAEGLVAARAIL